ncbi:MAG: tyrosine-type recombinase/integrase [Leptolyngbya sp. SIO3F4]|nr:tyrosine-type recombinase/integrase [Leptolyngbya sp. SIO3F4]
MYRHGLRASEAASLRWDAVLMDDGLLNIKRLKGSKSGVHPLKADELAALASLKVVAPGQYLFPSERGTHITSYGIASLVKRCGELAELPFKVHPHMLRHACGYYLANQGFDTRLIQEWMGHRDIKNTERYTALNVERFKEIQW